MLVLTRKLQEQIRIGNDITITILRVKGNSVRVGIEAPRDVRVIRGELPPKRADAAAAAMVESAVAATSCDAAVDESPAAEETDVNHEVPARFEPIELLGREACVM